MTDPIQAKGWLEFAANVLLHSLWQGALLAGLYRVLQRFLQSARVRYQLGVTVLFAMVLLPLATVLISQSQRETPYSYLQAMAAATDAVVADPTLSSGAVPLAVSEPLVDWTWRMTVGVVWLAGVILSGLRLLPGWQRLRVLRREGSPVEDEQVLATFARAIERLGVRQRIPLLTHSLVASPITFGWIRPVILLPCAVWNGLTVEQMESIFIHELAHIRRRDFLINALQSIIELLLFFHPAMWWLSRRIRQEREFACDDVVIELLENPSRYASALAKLEMLRPDRMDALAVGASDSNLGSRIRRILNLDGIEKPVHPRLGAAFTTVVCFFLFTGVMIAETETEKVVEEKRPPAWFPSETKGRERELAETILQQPEGELKHLAFASLVGRWIETNPDEALAFDKALEDPREKQTFFYAAAPSLCKTRPELVLYQAKSGRWWPEQYDHVSVAMSHLSRKSLDAAIEAFRESPEKLQQFLTGRHLARLITERDGPEAGLEFAESIENREASEGATRGAMHAWVLMDEPAAIAYTEGLEDGKEKSIAVLGMVAGKGRSQNPQECLDWVKTLYDDVVRRMALINMVWLWSLENNDEEMDRILGDTGITDEDRRIMERNLKQMDVRSAVREGWE